MKHVKRDHVKRDSPFIATPDVTATFDSLGRQISQSNGYATSTFAYDPATLAVDTETVSYDLDQNGTPELSRVIDRSRDSLGRDTGFQLKDGSTVENASVYSYNTTNIKGHINNRESP